MFVRLGACVARDAQITDTRGQQPLRAASLVHRHTHIRPASAWPHKRMTSAAASSPPPAAGLVNCVMLITWPSRREMIQHAILSFIRQDYQPRVLTVVNDGAPCKLSASFLTAACSNCQVLVAPAGASIGEKRNMATVAVPSAEFIASFDDDDFSLPSRVSSQVERMEGSGSAWLSASRKLVAMQTLDNIVGFEFGRCYGAGMIRAQVARTLPWPHVSYREDQQLYELTCAHPDFGSRVIEADDLLYVHRRHETNASAPYRQNLWQGIMPLQLGGADATDAAALVRATLAAAAAEHEALHEAYLLDDLDHDDLTRPPASNCGGR
jgi:hypothetical protein